MIDYSIRKFRPDTDTLKPFDCGNTDLNGFLLETGTKEPNATLSEKELMAATYIVEDNSNHDILAYFSILHDKIERQFVDKTIWNRLSRVFPNAKRRSSYPALKIGKLAVSNRAKSCGLGTQLLNYIEWIFLQDKRAGCRFITVDALLEAEGFYRKNFSIV
ncbi:MAG: GNAT family N-acetyltransferase [Bacteroidales bacterium]|nr:GNAT family N-acetyltransferase [Bacteroidales bacterium]